MAKFYAKIDMLGLENHVFAPKRPLPGVHPFEHSDNILVLVFIFLCVVGMVC